METEKKLVPRTSRGLQEQIFIQLDRLESGETTPQHARTVASLASAAIAVARLEMDGARFVTENRRGGSGALECLQIGGE